MHRRLLAAGFSGVATLAACSAPPQVRAPEQPLAAARSAASPSASAPLIAPLTLEGYKKYFAQRVAQASPDIFDEPMPEVFKSIVVLDITIDRDGRLLRASVRRSNGYRGLEERAMDSVRRAAPFRPPAFTMRERDGSVSFLETFLFRDDGRFQIRSLVAAR